MPRKLDPRTTPLPGYRAEVADRGVVPRRSLAGNMITPAPLEERKSDQTRDGADLRFANALTP